MTGARGVLATLAGIVFLRVLGVSLLFAGFAGHGAALGGSTSATGLAFAAYPAALAIFMLPLAWLSDRVGRRRVIIGALVVSAAGGVLAALAQDVLLLGLARFAQGAGAVNGVALALAGEIGDPAKRTSRMAILGAAAGIGFAAGIILGALLTPILGVPGLLLAHSGATLALLLPLARVAMPQPEPIGRPGIALGARTWTLGGAGFALNLALTGLLFLSPLLIAEERYTWAILAMVLPGGIGMFAAARLADRGHARAVGTAGAALLGLAPVAFLIDVGLLVLILAGIAFFVGHSSLSSLLPSLVASNAPEGRRGFAQGVQSTFQYLGSAAGAALVGALYPASVPLAALFVLAGAAIGLAILLAPSRETEIAGKPTGAKG